MKKLLEALTKCNPATASLILRGWANSSTCALIGMCHNAILREQRQATSAARVPGYLPIEGPTLDGRNEMDDASKDDGPTVDPMDDNDTKLNIGQLAEFVACVRAAAMTIASGLPGDERRFAEPQEVESSIDFMATPRTKVTQDQIDAVKEEEPTFTDEQAVAFLQAMFIEDAHRLANDKALVLSRVNEEIATAPADKEFDTIVLGMPETYQQGLIEKALNSVQNELDRTLKFAIRGVAGVSAKRRILKADQPALEAAAA